jgi:hypothetical protein
MTKPSVAYGATFILSVPLLCAAMAGRGEPLVDVAKACPES